MWEVLKAFSEQSQRYLGPETLRCHTLLVTEDGELRVTSNQVMNEQTERLVACILTSDSSSSGRLGSQFVDTMSSTTAECYRTCRYRSQRDVEALVMLAPLLPSAFPSASLPPTELLVHALGIIRQQLVFIARQHTALWREHHFNTTARSVRAVAQNTLRRLSVLMSSEFSLSRPSALLSHIVVVEKTTTLPHCLVSHGCQILDGILLPCRLTHILPSSTSTQFSGPVLLI